MIPTCLPGSNITLALRTSLVDQNSRTTFNVVLELVALNKRTNNECEIRSWHGTVYSYARINQSLASIRNKFNSIQKKVYQYKIHKNSAMLLPPRTNKTSNKGFQMRFPLSFLSGASKYVFNFKIYLTNVDSKQAKNSCNFRYPSYSKGK